MTLRVFSVQDETGTVAQLTLNASPLPTNPIMPGDTGLYEGFPDDGTLGVNTPAFQSLFFTVIDVLDNGIQFSVSTRNANMADWPAFGVITWQTGGNVLETSVVTEIDGANAYETVDDFKKYHTSRGNTIPDVSDAVIQTAIVKGSDYIDAKYKFSGVKKLQSVGSAVLDANSTFLESWLTPYSLIGVSYLTPTTTTQSTEWPRQGVTDFNGDTVNGIPKAIKFACSELAMRVLMGTDLQPDYDPSLVANGGVASSITKKVGPLETVIAYDTKFGLGFFASFPIVDRLLARAGLLSAGGSRTVIR